MVVVQHIYDERKQKRSDNTENDNEISTQNPRQKTLWFCEWCTGFGLERINDHGGVDDDGQRSTMKEIGEVGCFNGRGRI
ncbi:hypothetical protein V6N12_074683 [Hibiscus sabdariffa]|uniref:Uncharacterized protein n=1 Tax=Hibiscus sabdariffa TaxID=183260 RepID=A0ABR2BXZ1_9ROSI